jgi:tetratricopeptide (TPR) repeat protein
VQPVEPRLAWNEAVAVLRHLTTGADLRSLGVPSEWPALVASHEPEVALPFCTGNFPQLVRHLPALLQGPDPALLRTPSARPASPGLIEWAGRVVREGKFPQALLAVGVLRLARQFDAAAELLRQCQAAVPAAWRDAWANEEAALAWQRGQLEEAVALWGAQPESAPVLFNRGMAALFLGRPEEARSCLNRAVALLPEDSAWHHLGRLYLALAEMR